LRIVDLDPQDPAAATDDFAQTLEAVDRGVQVAFRNRALFVARLQPLPDLGYGQVTLSPNATYLVTGGLGGIGFRLASWLVSRGARSIVLAGRSVAPSAQSRAMEVAGPDCTIHVRRADVGSEEDLRSLIDDIQRSMPPLRGIIHTALALQDGVFINQTHQGFAAVFRPKARGAWLLHELTQALPLDLFVLFSSAGAVLGAAGQANYSAASAAMDAIAHYRRAQGLPALAINWGPWSYPGSPSEGKKPSGFDGYVRITPDLGLEWFERLLAADASAVSAQTGVMPFDREAWSTYCPQLAQPLLSRMPAQSESAPVLPIPAAAAAASTDLSKAEHVLRITEDLKRRIGRRLSCAPDAVPVEVSLQSLGFESLAIIELRNEIGDALGIYVSPRLLIKATGLRAMAEIIHDSMHAPVGGTVEAAPPLDVDSLTDEEVAAALDRLFADRVGGAR
jgi:myxalamid-type polyketide synthase MxaE and MxaD